MKIIFLCLLITGCTTVHDYRNVTNTAFGVRLSFHDELFLNGVRVKGLAIPPRDGVPCLVKMVKKHYTDQCFAHEMRHCSEGYWHGTKMVDCD